jgi:hypothetical protein
MHAFLSCVAAPFIYAGAVIATFNNVELYMTQAKIINNKATMNSGGGAFAFFDMTKSVFTDCLFDGNWVNRGGGGALAAFGPMGIPLVTLSNCTIKNNAVPLGLGGGLFCEAHAKILITNGTVLQNNTSAAAITGNCSVVMTGGSRVVNNTVPMGVGGAGFHLMDGGKLTVSGRSVIEGNSALDGPGGGGIYMVGVAEATLESAVLVHNIASIGGGVHASGATKLVIQGDTHFENNTAPVGPDLHVGPLATFDMQSSQLDPYGSTVLWQRTKCIPGEVVDQGVCRKCLPSTYSLVPGPEAKCQVCPENAVCATGGDSLIPEAGYWHSSPYSSQIHRCPHVEDVCQSNNTCAAGYGGNLCGVCEAGYGPSAAFSCGKCMSLSVQWVLYLAAGLLAVLLVAFTVHSTWRDNKLKPSHGLQGVRSSDRIKVLILFLQYLVIVSSLSVPWPSALAFMFRIVQFIFAASNGQLGAVSLDCVLAKSSRSSVPVAIQRQLVYLVAPIGILVGVMLLSTLKALVMKVWQASKHTAILRRGSSTNSSGSGSTSVNSGAHFHRTTIGSMLIKKLPLMCVVTFFFAYPFLVRVSLGMFACLRLDRATSPYDPYPQFAVANASNGYWVHAMQQPCFEGWHLPWALALGLPCVLLFCMATPLALLIGLTVHKSKLQRADVRAQFGFLYRPYVEKRCWWEGLMTVQTMLLVTVSVFRYTLGGYYSALLVNIMFSAMATLQLVFKPFASHRLHLMQMMATGCLYLTTCIALSLFSVDLESSQVFREVIGAVAVVFIVSFFIWCCYCILMEYEGFLGRMFRAALRPCSGVCASLCGRKGGKGAKGTAAAAAAAAGGAAGTAAGVAAAVALTVASNGSSGGSAIAGMGKVGETVPSDDDDGVVGDQGNQVISRRSPSQLPQLPRV